MRVVSCVARAQRDDRIDVLSLAQAVCGRGGRRLSKLGLREVRIPGLVQVDGEAEVLIVGERFLEGE